MNCARRIPRSFAGRMHCRSVRGGTLKLKCRHPAPDDVVERIERRGAERISTKTWETVRWARPHSSRLGPMRPVVPANLLGLPSACVPAGRDETTGVPIGVLVTGQRFREDLCLEAAEAIEARLGLVTPIEPVR